MIKWIDYDSEGTITGGYECEEDDNGKDIAELRYDYGGAIYERIEYEYDSNGNRIKGI